MGRGFDSGWVFRLSAEGRHMALAPPWSPGDATPRERTESIWFWIWIWSPLDSGVQSKSDSPLDSDSRAQSKPDSPLDSDSRVQSKSDSPLDSDSRAQSKSDSSLDSDSRVRARIGLPLGLGLLAYSGCGFGGRAPPPPLSRPSAWERKSNLPHGTKKQGT
jgi:hypothetical protein